MTRPVFDPLAEGFDAWAETLGLERFKPFLQGLPERTRLILDAGCGSGILAVHLADRAERVIAMDISPAMLAIAARRAAETRRSNVVFVLGDLSALPFGDGSFDCAVSSAALYNTRLDVSLPELRRVLAPGGRILVTDLVQRHPWLDRRPLWARLRALASAPGHATRFGFGTMRRLLAFRAGGSWVRHYTRPKLTPAELRRAYGRLLPGCRIDARRWDMFVFWHDPR